MAVGGIVGFLDYFVLGLAVLGLPDSCSSWFWTICVSGFVALICVLGFAAIFVGLRRWV